ncbi:MAG: cobalamin B12-binding domain-containing protein [Actinomycetota bacterium]
MRKRRILVAILGLDQHELGAVAVSRSLRDAGFEVVYAGRFNLPPMIVETAMQEGVDIIAISCGSWEYLYLVPELIEMLEERDMETPVIIGGPIITPGDEREMKQKGVAAVFGPSSTPEDIIHTIENLG